VLHQFLPVSWWNAHLEMRNLQEVIFSIVVALSVSFGLPALRLQDLRWQSCLALILCWLAIIVVWCAREGANIGGTFWLYILGGGATVYLAAFAAACTAATIDVMRGIRRDWLHYFAILMLAIYAVSIVLHYGDVTVKSWSKLYSYAFG